MEHKTALLPVSLPGAAFQHLPRTHGHAVTRHVSVPFTTTHRPSLGPCLHFRTRPRPGPPLLSRLRAGGKTTGLLLVLPLSLLLFLSQVRGTSRRLSRMAAPPHVKEPDSAAGRLVEELTRCTTRVTQLAKHIGDPLLDGDQLVLEVHKAVSGALSESVARVEAAQAEWQAKLEAVESEGRQLSLATDSSLPSTLQGVQSMVRSLLDHISSFKGP